jgi:hypothetical protein
MWFDVTVYLTFELDWMLAFVAPVGAAFVVAVAAFVVVLAPPPNLPNNPPNLPTVTLANHGVAHTLNKILAGKNTFVIA